MKEDRPRKATIIVNHYLRDDQYEWLRDHGNHSVLMRELIDAAMYDPYLLDGAKLARMHRAIRELDAILTEIRSATEAMAANRKRRARAQRRGAVTTLSRSEAK